MGIPWGDLVVGLVLLASGALGGSIFLLLKKGATATVAEIARTSESHLPETPDACSAPCDAHVALNSVVIELKKTVEAVVESMKVSADKVEKNHHEMFHRMANQDQSLAVTLQQMAEVRGQVGNIMADVAYMSAKMGKKHDAERIQKEVTDTLLAFVDDRAEQMGPLIQLIESAGFTVSTARDYNEAHNLLEALPFSYAVIDASLTPGEFDGVDLARWCLSRFPKMNIFLYSGFDNLDAIPPGVKFYRKPNLARMLSDISAAKRQHEGGNDATSDS